MEYECSCCKKYNDECHGITYKKLRDEYAYKMADDTVYPYAHKEALNDAKKTCPNPRDIMFNEHYFMYYRMCYQGMFYAAVEIFEEHYIANAVERFQGDINKTCDTFQARYTQYKNTGCALYRGGFYDTRNQQMYPELETALDTYYMTNQSRTPQ